MDTFMDKLAQKFTAQEMIKANSAAETEELNRLRTQVEQYTACLNRMQELCGEMERSAKQQTQTSRDEISRLTEESVEKIRQIQQNTAALEALQRKLELIQESVTELGKGIDTQDDLTGTLEEKKNDLTEFTHKEGVKIYRNVQASVQEENAKQTEALTGEVKKLRGKLGAVLGVSVVALVAALAGVALQVLTMLGIL